MTTPEHNSPDREQFELGQRARRVLQGSNCGSWEWCDLSKDEFWWSARTFTMFGYNCGDFVPTRERFLAMVHPEDREHLSQLLSDRSEEGPYQAEYRIRTKTGSYAWFQLRGMMFRNESGTPHCMAGTVHDITQQKEQNEKLRESEALFRCVFEKSAIPIATTDLSGRFTRVNDAACRMLGYTREDLLCKTFVDITYPEDVEFSIAHFERLLRGDFEHYSLNKRYLRSDGQTEWGTVTVSLMRDSVGKPSYIVAQLLDTSKLNRVEKALASSETWFRSLIELSTSIYVVLDSDGIIRYLSPSVEHHLGWSAAELLGTSTFEKLHEEDLPAVQEAFGRVLQSPGSEETIELRHIHKDGTWRWLRAIGVNRLDNEAVKGVVVSSQDITARKIMEQSLRRSEASLREAQSIAHFGNWEIDVQTANITLSDEIFRILDLRPGTVDLNYETLIELVHPEDRSQFERDSKTLATTGKVEFKFRAIRQDGKVRWISGRGEASFNQLGEPTRMFGVMQDITEREQAMQESRKNESQLSSAVDIAKLGLWEHDVESGIFTFTDSFYAVFRTTAEEMGGYQMSAAEYTNRFVHPDDSHVVAVEGRRASETDDPDYSSYLEHRMLYADGSVGHVAVRGFIVKDTWGRTLKTYGVNQDITHRKQAEVELERRHRDLESLYRISEAVTVDEPLDKMLQRLAEEVSAATEFPLCAIESYDEERQTMRFLAISGIPADDGAFHVEVPLSQTLSGLVVQTGSPVVEFRALERPEYASTILRGLKVNTFVCVPLKVDDRIIGTLSLADPKVVTLDEHVLPFVSSLANSIAAILKRKRAEDALRESEVQFRAIFEQAAVGVAQVTLEGRWYRVNQKLCEIVGYSREELQCKTFQDLTHPDDLEAGLRNRERMLAGAGSTYATKKRYLCKDGSLAWINLAVALVRKPSGDPDFFITVVEDITEQNNAERELRNREVALAHMNRLHTVGEMAGTLAHELSQPLYAIKNYVNAVSNYVQRVHHRLDDEVAKSDLEQTNEALHRVSHAVERADGIVSHLRDLVRGHEPRRSAVNMRRLLQETVHLLSPLAREKAVALHIDLENELPMVHADPVQVEQVVINLVTNAIDAVAGLPKSQREVRINCCVTDNGLMEVIVRDAGRGIPVPRRETIFDAFVTTKEQGLGLGLAISRTIVEAHGGKIWVVHNDSQGPGFHFTLPTDTPASGLPLRESVESDDLLDRSFGLEAKRPEHQ